MYNSYFTSPDTSRNGTFYCYLGDDGARLSSSCNSGYTVSTAKLDTQGRMYDFTPQTTKNVLLPSNIKQSFSVGDQAEFMWMHLNKPSTTLTYTPTEDRCHRI